MIQFQWNSNEEHFLAYSSNLRTLSNISDGVFLRKIVAVHMLYESKFWEKLYSRGKNWYIFDTILIYYDKDTYLTIIDTYLTMDTFSIWWRRSKFGIKSTKRILAHIKEDDLNSKAEANGDRAFCFFFVFQFPKHDKRNINKEVWLNSFDINS